MSKKIYVAKSTSTSEHYTFKADSIENARHYVINHFDCSQTWEVGLANYPLPVFYPEDIPAQWDNVEVEAIEMLDEINCERTDKPEEADFWSVYLHDVKGGVSCIADVATKDEANKLADLLLNAAKAFTPRIN